MRPRLKTKRSLWLIMGLTLALILACSVTQVNPATPIVATRVVRITQLVVPKVVEVTRVVQATPVEVTQVISVTQVVITTEIVQVVVEVPAPVQTPAPALQLDTDTLLLLHFDEPVGTTLFQDSSPYKYHAVCHPAACPTRAERGLNFNGQDSYIMSSASIQGLSGFTLAGWYYARSYEQAGKSPVAFLAPGVDCGRAALRIGGENTQGPVLFVADSDNCQPQEIVSAPDAPSLNQWHYIVAVFDADTDQHTIYVDGNKVAESNYPIGSIPDTTPGHSMYIGVNFSPRPGDQRWWDGYIDELILYNRALSASEVETLYNSSR
jgi:hypothetical protein